MDNATEAIAGRELNARGAGLLSLLVLTMAEWKSDPDNDSFGSGDIAANEDCSVDEVAIVKLIRGDVVSGEAIIVTEGGLRV